MQDNNRIEIRISRIIPASKWRVIRLLTKVEEFPLYIPTVKEAKVIYKKENLIRTKWLVQVEGIPINWTEEDTLSFQEDSIYFKAIDGDLTDLQGHWKFLDHEHGTEVILTLQARIVIPIIKDFAEDHIRRILTKNFEAILSSIEQRLVSVKYTNYKQSNIKKIAGFGIVGHFYNFKHFERYILENNPEAKIPSQEFINSIFRFVHPFKAFDITNFRSITGQAINGCFILATFFPDMIETDPFGAFSKVVKSCKIAEKHSMGIVGLGGFAALVGDKIDHEISAELDIPLTTGRTFTAAIVIDSVLKAAGLFNLKIQNSRITIVGGAGNIGSAVTRVLSKHTKYLTITGKNKDHLKKISTELKKTYKNKVTVETNNQKAVKNADIVICAASVSNAILDINWFKPKAIICDVGYPKNVSYLSEPRNDIFLFDGGLAKSPTPLNLPINVGLHSDDIIYGCFAESIILGLEEKYENFSSNNASITPYKIEEIRILAKKHGFEAADFHRNGKLIERPI